MGTLKSGLLFLLLVIVLFHVNGCTAKETIRADSIDLPLFDTISGEYPVSELGRLPPGQQDTTVGYIGDTETFIPVWRAFMPNEILPEVDFSNKIIVFSRNTQFYNRTIIFKVTLSDGVAEIFAMETMSAIPIDDKVAMAMAVIPREGVTAIKGGAVAIKVKPYQ
ncbi:MAG: hypothetical protein R3297_10010 [Desulfobulbales bacterium]|nr:hypothetical protein [Desulfobulbales bacterium]